jgi:hypothetical protein
LQALERVLGGGWQEILDDHKAGSASIADSLALIHPLNISGNQAAICGPRQFAADPAYRFQVCQCELYWQLKCEHRESPHLYADHVFPYSLGGPTVPENRMMLCGVHNRMKSNDIHFFPWERGLPVWFASVLTRIEARRRYSGEP